MRVAFVLRNEWVPWAAFIQNQKSQVSVLEQGEITARLAKESPVNPDAVDLELAIQQMKDTEEIKIQKS